MLVHRLPGTLVPRKVGCFVTIHQYPGVLNLPLVASEDPLLNSMVSVLAKLPSGAQACSPIFSLDDDTLFVASANSGEISSLVKEDGAEANVWAVTGGQPKGIAWDASALPKGSVVYTADLTHGVLSVGSDGSRQVVVAEYEKKKLKV